MSSILIPSPEISSVSGHLRRAPANLFSLRSKPRTFQPFRNVVKSRIQDFDVAKAVGFRDFFAVGTTSLKEGSYGVLSTKEEVGEHGFGVFSSAVDTTSLKASKEEEEKQNYYVNTGDAIRTIREEFPEVFYREPSFDIYRDDIIFKDPLNTFYGIENYKSIFWALRVTGKMFFKALWVDIASVWQPVENLIIVRWTVSGIPRVPWESRGRFDGVSEYKLDKNGKIFEHRVHNVVLHTPPKFQMMSVDELILSISSPSTPKPTYFEIPYSYISDILSSSVEFSGMSQYLNSESSPEAEPSQRS